jgi:hypothetical protein
MGSVRHDRLPCDALILGLALPSRQSTDRDVL